MEISEIVVPAFVHETLGKSRCHRCERALSDAWIRGAGVRLDSENRACFAVMVWCSGCEERREFIFQSRPMMREEWWYDIAAMIGDAARPDRVHVVLSNLKVLSDAPVLFRERGKIKRLDLYGAYAGDAGPVMFMFRRAHPNRPYGVARLERRDQLHVLPVSDPEVLGVSRWLWFASLATGARFNHRGRAWEKLSPECIRGIVIDRVFEPYVGHGRKRGR